MVGDALEDVGEVGVRVDAVHLAGEDQALEDADVLGAELAGTSTRPMTMNDCCTAAPPRSPSSASRCFHWLSGPALFSQYGGGLSQVEIPVRHLRLNRVDYSVLTGVKGKPLRGTYGALDTRCALN